MSLDSLTRTDFRTGLGVIPLWHRPGALQGGRTAMIAINAAFVDRDVLSQLPLLMADLCDVFIMQLPGNHAPPLTTVSLPAFAAALDAVIDRAFARRPVVLTGIGMGACVALAARAAPVRRIVAVEPILATGGLWPVQPALSRLHAERPGSRPLVEALYGVTASGMRARNHAALLNGLRAPADVLLGGVELGAPRTLDRHPSLVNEAARRTLADNPNVHIQLAPGVGHNVSGLAPDLFRRAVEAAVRAAPGRDGFDPALLLRASLTARTVAYAGPAPDAFAAAYRRRNPSAHVAAAARAEALPGGPFDLVVLDRLEMVTADRLETMLAGDGLVVAGTEGDTAPPSCLRVLRCYSDLPAPDFFDDVEDAAAAAAAPGRKILLARRAESPPVPPVHVRLITYAPRLMDIRTRLPSQALRADAELAVAFHGAPFRAPDDPTVLLFQRPGIFDHASWRGWQSVILRKRCIIVLEWDDHPELVTKAIGMKIGPEEQQAFGWAHAIQTSTPELAAFFSRFNPEVRVFGNSVFDLPPFPEGPRPPRIFYGAAPRGDYSVEMVRSLAPVLSDHPEAEVVVVGDKMVFDAVPTANKRFHGFLPYEYYLSVMGSCSVLLTPLEPGVNDTKSDAKFLDASSRGLLTIASPTVYAGSVRHGETGLIALEIADWGPLLARALADPDAARVMARRAWEQVRDQRMFAHQASARREWYADLLRRRPELDTGVRARLPGL